MSFNVTSLNRKLWKHNTLFSGIKLWVLLLAFFIVILVAVVILIVIVVGIIYLCRRKSKSTKPLFRLPNHISRYNFRNANSASSSLDRRLLSRRISEIEMNIAKLEDHNHPHPDNPVSFADLESAAMYSPVVPDTRIRSRFTLREVEAATNGFNDDNVIGIGDNGIVYRGLTLDATRVAVKRLLRKSCQAEEFNAEMEVIGHVRHKNLVKLLGYCMEGGYRILVNEYVDNGNLHQWLHACPQQVSPLTWAIRTNIIQGIAKGLAYLHEDIEPKMFHQDLKSNNILLDRQWNPKISDFGLSKLFDPEWDQETCRLRATSGHAAQDYCASTEILNERGDVYSFGVLVMEIICGRLPIDYNQPQECLIDWLKSMIASRKTMYVVDPKLPVMPSSKELKRLLLLALRCVDPDIKHRPTMGDAIHMLEPRDLLLDDGTWIREDSPSRRSYQQGNQIVAEESAEGTLEREGDINVYQKMMLR